MFVKSELSPLEFSFPAINSRFKLAFIAWWFLSNHVVCAPTQIASEITKLRKLDSNKLWSFFWPPDIINFLLKSLSIITSIQSKQIYSFDAHMFDCFGQSGTDNFRHSIEGLPKVTWDPSCKSHHSSFSHALKTNSALKFKRSTCSKFS